MNRTHTESISLSTVLPSTPEKIYKAWLSSKEHTAFTDSAAEIEPHAGGKFSVWDGYITGKTMETEPFTRIVQSWRTTEFPAESEDSLLEILFEETKKGTKITLNHSNIPKGQGQQYKQGWEEFYFEPMIMYFGLKKK
jgi:activator of HSP90 ATPase